jgi:hypothetical protein
MGASFSMTPERLREALSAGNNGGGNSNDSDLASGASGYSFGRAEMQEESYFKNMTDDPTKAVLFFYLNSGLFRFEQHRDHTTSDDLKMVNLDQLKMDIEGEMLTPLEYNDVVRRFYSQHPFMDFTSKSCTACGIRLIERTEDPYISYIDVPLTEPNIIEALRYSPQQALDLTRRRDAPESIVTIPFDANWNQHTINLTSAISFFESSHDGAPVFWHLHPELVGSMPDGTHCATLCPICHESVMRNKTIPRLSIAAGVDFGYFQRLGLVYPNLHEQLILSRTRLYFSVIKVSSNLKGQVNMNHRNKVRCHSIMFPHNASEIASNMFGSSLRGEGGLLQLEELRKLLHLYMVDPQGRPDAIAKDIFQTVNLLARPHVVAQWLIVLKWLNPHYADLDLFDLKRTVVDSLELLNKEIIDQCHTINDPDVLEYEMALGSDVAGVRNTEILEPGAGVQRCHDVDPAGVEFNDISYSYVTNSEAAYYSGGTEDFRLKALDTSGPIVCC